jgi:hypothetical protein
VVQAATAVPVRGPQAPRWAIPASVTLRGRTWATLDAVAAVLIALHAIVLTVILLPGSLYIDDFRARRTPRESPSYRSSSTPTAPT